MDRTSSIELPTRRVYFHGGPLDGRVYIGLLPSEVEPTIFDGGRYKHIETFTAEQEFLPGKFGQSGDAWFRWEATQ